MTTRHRDTCACARISRLGTTRSSHRHMHPRGVAEGGSDAAVRLLLTKGGADATVGCTTRGRTPLHIAALHGHWQCVTALLRDGGADANVPTRDDARTPLHLAAEVRSSDVARRGMRMRASTLTPLRGTVMLACSLSYIFWPPRWRAATRRSCASCSRRAARTCTRATRTRAPRCTSRRSTAHSSACSGCSRPTPR